MESWIAYYCTEREPVVEATVMVWRRGPLESVIVTAPVASKAPVGLKTREEIGSPCAVASTVSEEARRMVRGSVCAVS